MTAMNRTAHHEPGMRIGDRCRRACNMSNALGSITYYLEGAHHIYLLAAE